jgi:hypothetical protein
MAEAKAFEEEGSNSKTHLTPPMSQPRPQGQPSKPTPPLPPNTNKRKLIDIIPTNPNSSYFKIRALTRQLRPHFIEVHYISKHLVCQYFYASMSRRLISLKYVLLFLVGLCYFFILWGLAFICVFFFLFIGEERIICVASGLSMGHEMALFILCFIGL